MQHTLIDEKKCDLRPYSNVAKVSVNEIIGGLNKRTLAYVVLRLLFYALSEFHLTGYKFGRSYCNSDFLYREKQTFQ